MKRLSTNAIVRTGGSVVLTKPPRGSLKQLDHSLILLFFLFFFPKNSGDSSNIARYRRETSAGVLELKLA